MLTPALMVTGTSAPQSSATLQAEGDVGNLRPSLGVDFSQHLLSHRVHMASLAAFQPNQRGDERTVLGGVLGSQTWVAGKDEQVRMLWDNWMKTAGRRAHITHSEVLQVERMPNLKSKY